MRYFSESYFRSVANSMPLYERRTYSENLQGASIDKEFDVFLSYNIADLDVVKGIYYTLSKMGLKVYLDCIVDVDLKRNETDKDTAVRLQKRLKNSRSLIYAQSPEAGRSNWMPWELGVVDGNTGKGMIMPVTRDAQHASPQREYLLLYTYIMYSEIEGQMRVLTETYSYGGEDLRTYIRK